MHGEVSKAKDLGKPQSSSCKRLPPFSLFPITDPEAKTQQSYYRFLNRAASLLFENRQAAASVQWPSYFELDPLRSGLGIFITPNSAQWGMLIHDDPTDVRTGCERGSQCILSSAYPVGEAWKRGQS